MSYPIPKDALDDRLAIVGTAGSGKTYLTMGAMEHLFARHSRVIGVDPLGVLWGLRLCEDGKTASPFQPVIFGGAHGDLPINEHAGALIGETVATMRESCILDLSQLGTKAAERRFMLAFLTALYRHTNKEPVHIIIDEADMFAPQKLLDKDGDAAKLLGMMETVVRRGRVKGFVPWLITQRPAVLSKDVLSQADGIVALKLTASQDRKAIGGWVESTADQGRWKEIDGQLPAFQMGQGVLWIPARGILRNVGFPPKATYDSSRTPKRGEKRQAAELKSIDLTALKDKLGKVEAETKANDPKALKAEIARLKSEAAKAPLQRLPSPMQDRAYERTVEGARKEGFGEGFAQGWTEGDRDGFARGAGVALDQGFGAVRDALKAFTGVQFVPGKPPRRAPNVTPAPLQSTLPRAATPASARHGVQPAPRPPRAMNGDSTLSKPQTKILGSLAWWAAMGHAEPTRAQVAVKAGMKYSAGHFRTRMSELSGMEFIRYIGADRVGITDAGASVAPEPILADSVADTIRPLLSSPQLRIFNALMDGATSRDDIAARAGMEASAGHFRTRLSELSTFGIVEYPDRQSAALQDWVTA